MGCEIPPSLSMVDPNSKKDSEKIEGSRLDIMETFKFLYRVNHAINKHGFASHAIPVPLAFLNYSFLGLTDFYSFFKSGNFSLY
ncbi:MAG: hypothetical protein JNK69_13540 [Saprospiraceae bacterium]|nr:hypothetical protein [Candidatus Vicinibacter proximus]MBL7824426.1 hypothetical protein [Saprospiraceae bacterium]